ncbi:hypothetical protein BDN72DRAFT_834798 [Pluteus cervinus]|uniref:Uncharacterized protein n=1 Tax=Pluteus cervinus TaxID=181527 RepID=A0ACD3B666_9AGAR|nr:hypothetical protein BDN72DRAFT_834798 [Pluteus cervinus]
MIIRIEACSGAAIEFVRASRTALLEHSYEMISFHFPAFILKILFSVVCRAILALEYARGV